VVGVGTWHARGESLDGAEPPNSSWPITRDAKMGAIRRLIADDRLPVNLPRHGALR